MKTFNYLFGILLGEVILRNIDNLSRTLQHQHLSAAEGQHVVSLTEKTLDKIRTYDAFELFWGKAALIKSKHDISEPDLPRRRKAPRRYEVGESSGDFHNTSKSYYKQQYLEALGLIINNFVKKRFAQPGYTTYIKIQDLLLKSANGEQFENEILFVTDFYGGDIDKAKLETQLTMVESLCSDLESPDFRDIVEKFKSLSQAEQSHFSEVVYLLRLLLAMPATNAVSEHSASALRLIKTYLRTSMSQLRINNLMVLHIHKQNLDHLNMVEVANDFVTGSEHRLTLFGTFT